MLKSEFKALFRLRMLLIFFFFFFGTRPGCILIDFRKSAEQNNHTEFWNLRPKPHLEVVLKCGPDRTADASRQTRNTTRTAASSCVWQMSIIAAWYGGQQRRERLPVDSR